MNFISIDDERSAGLIRDIPFGTLAPGESSTRTLHLVSAGAAGDRSLDISITANTPDARDAADGEVTGEEPTSPAQIDKTVYQETIQVPTLAPFTAEDDVAYIRCREEWQGVATLDSFEVDHVDQRQSVEAAIWLKLAVAGPWGVWLEKVELEIMDAPEIRVVNSSVDLQDGDLSPCGERASSCAKRCGTNPMFQSISREMSWRCRAG